MGKKRVSFNMKALFTNVPVKGALEAEKKVLEKYEYSDLPESKVDYWKFVSVHFLWLLHV